MSSSSYSSGPDLTLATLTTQELAQITGNINNHAVLRGTFSPDLHASTMLQYFAYISTNIHKIEQDLERHCREQEEMFEVMMNNRQFRRKIRPIIHFHRQTTTNIHRPTRIRVRPYERPSTPHPSNSSSSLSSRDSRRSVVIHPEDALVPRPSSFNPTNPSTSFYTTEEPNPNAQPGSSLNPINVDEEENDTCTRCKQKGYVQEDCDTPLRSFTKCEACLFLRQTICDHYDVTPAWEIGRAHV